MNQLMDAVKSGGVFCVGTFLHGRADAIMIRDKTSGQRRESFVIRETIITDTDAIAVTRWMKDGEKGADYKPPFKKGERVACRVSGMEMRSGSVVLNGVLEQLVD